jgi:hypothetical protein
MTQNLEEQKRILLDRIRYKRAEYRRQLLPYDKLSAEEQGLLDDDTFPRSIAFKLLTHHPYFLLIVAAGLVFAGPRKTIIAAITSSALAALQRYGMDHLFHFGR